MSRERIHTDKTYAQRTIPVLPISKFLQSGTHSSIAYVSASVKRTSVPLTQARHPFLPIRKEESHNTRCMTPL